MKNEWVICPNCQEPIVLDEKSHFISQASMVKLEESGIAEKVYYKKTPELFSYSVAGIIHVWNGRNWRKTTAKFDPERYI